jgi:hypothetical protein
VHSVFAYTHVLHSARSVEISAVLKTALDTALTHATTAESALTASEQQHTAAASTAVQLQAELTTVQVHTTYNISDRS